MTMTLNACHGFARKGLMSSSLDEELAELPVIIVMRTKA
jgi:hypothetical protein